MNRSRTLQIGYVRSAFGVRGEVAVRCFDPRSDAFRFAKRLQLIKKDGTPCVLVIESVRFGKNEVIVHFQSLRTRSEASRLAGARVSVFRDELPTPGENELFQGDLVGLEATTESGERLGKVEEIWNTGPVPNLVIRDGRGSELIVPFAGEFVRELDLVVGRLVVRPLEYAE